MKDRYIDRYLYIDIIQNKKQTKTQNTKQNIMKLIILATLVASALAANPTFPTTWNSDYASKLILVSLFPPPPYITNLHLEETFLTQRIYTHIYYTVARWYIQFQ